MSGLLLLHVTADCTLPFEDASSTVPIIDDIFTFEVPLDQGKLTVKGIFTSSTTCSGTYVFEALPAGGACPSAGSSTFTAVKQP